MVKKNNVNNMLQGIPSMEDVEGFDQLIELALNLRWSWNHAADDIWRAIDPDFWDCSHNPWVLLQSVSRDKIQKVLADPVHRKNIDALLAIKKHYSETPEWFPEAHKNSPLKCVAYFCMEFMLSEALPIYSGGLGNVAGDQLKSASDLGVPVVGIGLLYQQGYFHQVIGKEGVQEAFFPANDSWQLPTTPLRAANGEWLRIKLDLPHLQVWLRVWQVLVGGVKLYLLDSNDAANYPPYRGITTELYGGGTNKRLMQELILGLGGWQLLSVLGMEPEVCHLNEGHAAFAILARAHSFMQKTGQSFETALLVTRAGNLFTTHTAVKAGFDLFEPSLIGHYLSDYAEKKLGISCQQLFALGRQNPNDETEKFNMAYLSIRGSGAVNAVSRLHGCVSRDIFAQLFPRWPTDEVPVKYVTNGIHTPSWISGTAYELWHKTCGECCWRDNVENVEKNMRKLSDKEIWESRVSARKSLVEFVRGRISMERSLIGESPDVVEQAKKLFNPNALILGFARRFATYKRTDILLRNKERLLRLLSNSERPVQLIIAGKAHPADMPGQAMIKEWIDFIRRPEVRPHIIFLSDHDMLITKQLVQGVDVWLNTPRRPWEACGTSGMKVLANGGINLSELDGWWAEAYTPDVGWALGDGQEHSDIAAWDAKEAEDLYTLLENNVIPEFYARNKEGLSVAWVTRIRASMSRLTPQFSTNRTVREYVEEHYLPAAKAYLARAKNKGELGAQIARWRQELDQKWSALRFGELKIKTNDKNYDFEIPVFLHTLNPLSIRVELYANGVNQAEAVRIEMTCAPQKTGVGQDSVLYSARVPKTRNASDYTPRIIPSFASATAPLEATHILWQR